MKSVFFTIKTNTAKGEIRTGNPSGQVAGIVTSNLTMFTVVGMSQTQSYDM